MITIRRDGEIHDQEGQEHDDAHLECRRELRDDERRDGHVHRHFFGGRGERRLGDGVEQSEVLLAGLGALIGPEYPLALPMLGLVTLAAALVAVYVSAVEASLEATIAAAVRLLRAPVRITRPPFELFLPLIPVLARAAAGRAPPHVLIRHP